MNTLIIGGGLSGLVIADALERRGDDYMLVEARGRFGGRIKTENYGAGYYDMGPAWFWPGQPRIAALVERFGLAMFDQYADGILTFEDELGNIHRGQGFSSMEGSWRLKGGLGALTQALADPLPESRKRLGAPVTSLAKSNKGITATFTSGDSIAAARVVMAMPPRLAAEIACFPALPKEVIQSMRAIPTWMAGQAKAIAIYEKPLWRDEGLSGDAMSRRGPMVEIHDASPREGGPHALFGFIGVSPQARTDEQRLRQSIMNQLGRLFGAQAANPEALFVKDWAFDTYTSTQQDAVPVYTHPSYGLPHQLRGLWDDGLLFAGSEVAFQFGGYVEGALEAAENVVKQLKK